MRKLKNKSSIKKYKLKNKGAVKKRVKRSSSIHSDSLFFRKANRHHKKFNAASKTKPDSRKKQVVKLTRANRYLYHQLAR